MSPTSTCSLACVYSHCTLYVDWPCSWQIIFLYAPTSSPNHPREIPCCHLRCDAVCSVDMPGWMENAPCRPAIHLSITPECATFVRFQARFTPPLTSSA
jgi:hypothetical protein